MKNEKVIVSCIITIILVMNFPIFLHRSDMGNDKIKNQPSNKLEKDEKIYDGFIQVIDDNSEGENNLLEDYYMDGSGSSMIRLENKTKTYIVIDNTFILDKPQGKAVKLLDQGEHLSLQSLHGEYGYFNCEKYGVSGYVNLGDLSLSKSEYIYGVSNVNKVIKEENDLYVLAMGEEVTLKYENEENMKILDEEGMEFQVSAEDITTRKGSVPPSRAFVSRKTKSLIKIVSAAYDLLGKPYIYGDSGRKGYDCSGLVYSIYMKELGIRLPRSASEQSGWGIAVKKNQLIPGDLIFFNTSGKSISHVGIYIGEGNMIHASSGKKQVRIDSIDTDYYRNRYIMARRIVE